MIAKLQKGDINIADVFLNELSRNPAYFNMDAVKTLIPNEEQRMRILRVLEDHMVIEIKGGGIWLKAAANLSVCKDQGGCAVIYNEQRKQEERDNLELRNFKSKCDTNISNHIGYFVSIHTVKFNCVEFGSGNARRLAF